MCPHVSAHRQNSLKSSVSFRDRRGSSWAHVGLQLLIRDSSEHRRGPRLERFLAARRTKNRSWEQESQNSDGGIGWEAPVSVFLAPPLTLPE
jgi:hypothetical protein